MLVTRPQIAALYAMSKTAPIFDLDTDLHGQRLLVSAPDGRRWLISDGGQTYRVNDDQQQGASAA